MNVLEKILYPVVDELAESVEGARRLTKSPESPLYGKDSPLDSLALVTLIAAVEERVEDELDLSVTIADERAMSRKNSPFRTLGSLAEYVEELIREKQAV
jgi:acyl carrier protein